MTTDGNTSKLVGPVFKLLGRPGGTRMEGADGKSLLWGGSFLNPPTLAVVLSKFGVPILFGTIHSSKSSKHAPHTHTFPPKKVDPPRVPLNRLESKEMEESGDLPPDPEKDAGRPTRVQEPICWKPMVWTCGDPKANSFSQKANSFDVEVLDLEAEHPAFLIFHRQAH